MTRSPGSQGLAMVRALLIRHAESTENVAMHGVIASARSGGLPRAKVGAAIQTAMDAATPDDGDAPLSARGEEEARALGGYWLPLLRERAAAGGVVAFVSPQLRCLATADALLRPLFEESGLCAQVLPDMIEIGGMCTATHHSCAVLPASVLGQVTPMSCTICAGMMSRSDRQQFFRAYEPLVRAGRNIALADCLG